MKHLWEKLPQNKQHLWIIYIIIGVFFLSLLLLLTSNKAKTRVTQEKSWPVSSIIAKRETVAPKINLYGNTNVPSLSKLESAITATVQSVPAKEGQIVQPNQILLKLNETQIALIVQQRQASVDEIKAKIKQEETTYQFEKNALKHEQKLYKLSERKVERESKLNRSNVTSKANLDKAREARAQQAIALNKRLLNIENHQAKLAELNAKLTHAQSALALAVDDFSKSELSVPFLSKVTKIHVAPGNRVQPNELLLELFAINELEVRAFIANRYRVDFMHALNQQLPIKAQAVIHGHQYNLIFNRLAGSIKAGSGAIEAIFHFQESPVHISLNEPIVISVTLFPKTNIITLPMSALYADNTIYKIVEHRLQKVEIIRLGEVEQVDKSYQVLIDADNINDGDKILASTLPNAASGLLVEDTVVNYAHP